MPETAADHPVTPDGRYFVVRGRLWRMSNPDLGEDERASLVSDLMAARRDVGAGLKAQDREAVRDARRRVDAAKRPSANGARCGGRTGRRTSTGISPGTRAMRRGSTA